MELDFDKEIDAILRKAHRDGPVLVGDFTASRHLDADELSAFAENAMPEKSRALHMGHLADCNRCRKILSELLVMNAESQPMPAANHGVIPIAGSAVPWYRKLFLFPNIAYVMGSLVLIFGGFLAVTVIRNSGTGDTAFVSQVSEQDSTQSGPNFQAEAPLDLSAANATSNTAANSNAAATFAANASSNNLGALRNEAQQRGGIGSGVTDSDDKPAVAIDGLSSGAAPPAAQPVLVATPAPKDALAATSRERDEAAKTKSEEKSIVNEKSVTMSDSAIRQQTQLPSVAGPNKQSGPSRNSDNQYNRQLENLDRRAAAKKSDRYDNEPASGGRRTVGGKTFERKERVWYDTTYQGRPTINVRRGSEEFKRLDGGLRSLANSLSGTVVIVWGAKAYRIQ